MARILAAFILFFALIPAALAAEDNERESWFGDQLQTISTGLAGIGRFIVNGIGMFFKVQLDFLGFLFTLWLESVFDGLKAFFFVIKTLWSLHYWVISHLAQWTLDLLELSGKDVISWFFKLLDDMVVLCVAIFGWFVGILPNISLPGGFDEGMGTAISYGMLFNEIVPVTHGIFCLGVLLGTWFIVGIVRLIIKFVPFIG